MTLLDIDPNVVRPGWTPLIVTVLLGVALVFLFLSLRHQLGKINVPGDPAGGEDEAPPTPEDTPKAHSAG